MKKRVLSFALALLLFVMIPAETVMAMPAAQAESMITLTEEVEATEDVVDDSVVEEAEEEVEPTEAPVEEEVVEATEEPTAEVEATEEPTVEATEEPAGEEVVEPTAEPEATAVPEVTPEAEATEEPVATEEPTAEVEATEEPIAEATEEPSATPTAEPAKEPAKKDVQVAGRDLTAKVVGSNGIQYDNVEYLSVQAVNSLSSEEVEAYIQLCDEIAALQESGNGIDKAVLSLNKNGELSFVIRVPSNVLFSADVQEELLDDVVEETTEEVVGEEDVAEETTEEVVEEEDVTEETTEEVVEEEDVVEETTEEVVEEEDVVEETTEEVVEVEDITEKSVEATDVEYTDVVIEENVELAKACEIPEEVVMEADLEYIGTKMSNANYFKNQLSSEEKGIYNAAFSGIVKGGRNSFNYKGGYLVFSNIGRAVSALNISYPGSFDWMKPGGYTGGKGYWSGGKWNYTITIDKSKHYSSTLEKKAKAKVKTIVKEAKADAKKNYPGNYVYGMVKYFDSWIRTNNYYNNVGTEESKINTKTYYYCHSSYGVLLKGYGVCESYALAMTRLLDAAGIRNIYATGYAGGGHAWNYVQMPNGSWYLLDTTWNDNTYAGDDRFLAGSATDGNVHRAHGYMYDLWSYGFTYPALASADYNSNTEKTYLTGVTLEKTTYGVKKGKTTTIKVKKPSGSNYFFKKYPTSWKSSNTNVAKVSKSGKVTGVNPGSATITYTIAGISKTCTVYVYQFSNLKFAANSKTSYSYTFANSNTVFDTSDAFQLNIAVNQKTRVMSAADLRSKLGLNAPKVKTSNSKVATATATLSGDTITLKVTPKKIGSATITVSFAGKTATLKLKNRYNIATNSGWFDYTKITAANNTIYSGKEVKPKVSKTTAAPKGLEYSVSYKNNKNAGTATVTIKGKGSYTGKIEKTFKIVPKSITTAKFKSCSTSKTYNGAAQKATTTVMMGKTKLKAGKDYIVNYNNSTTVPTNVGKYTVKIVGTGNYTGTVYADNVIATKVYEIKPLKLEKATITCTASRKYTGSTVKAPTVTVKYGKKTIPATQYTITYKNSSGAIISAAALKDKGTYKVIITPKGSNFVAGTKTQVTKTFKIVKK